jgi:hypothetical protein
MIALSITFIELVCAIDGWHKGNSAGNRMFIALAVKVGREPSRRPRRVVDLPSKLLWLFRRVPTPFTVY